MTDAPNDNADLGGTQYGATDPRAEKKSSAEKAADQSGGSIDGPRLTPQGRTGDGPEGEDSTDPIGRAAKTGQVDKAEG